MRQQGRDISGLDLRSVFFGACQRIRQIDGQILSRQVEGPRQQRHECSSEPTQYGFIETAKTEKMVKEVWASRKAVFRDFSGAASRMWFVKKLGQTAAPVL